MNKDLKGAFLVGIFGISGIVSIYLFYSQSLLLAGILGLIVGTALYIWHSSEDLFYFTSGAVLGPLAEIVCIQAGAWSYANPDFLGIPVWLPLAWGKVTLMVERSYHIHESLRGMRGLFAERYL